MTTVTMSHDDEFVAVRVQDPRVQNEGLWNSHVDYKIFLHTNSKAFTAKTSCVRRRYSEFAWLKKRLQKNAGLVPVPDLPGKSFFSFSNEDFLERRRQGLQVFLDKVVNMTVCLSDSQLHLFLQTQLPVGHILDCVQGHTPYTVTDAILTYASSNRGWAQAQEDDVVAVAVQEPALNVSYESVESPAHHKPRHHDSPPRSPPLAADVLEPRDKAGTTIFYLGDEHTAKVAPGSPLETTAEVGASLPADLGSSNPQGDEVPVASSEAAPGRGDASQEAASLASSNESIVQVSDEEDAVGRERSSPNGSAETSPERDDRWLRVPGGSAADLRANGGADRELSNSLDVNFAQNDFSVLGSSSAPDLALEKNSDLPD
ncbi:sorting nexin-11 [Stigmatopora argus]